MTDVATVPVKSPFTSKVNILNVLGLLIGVGSAASQVVDPKTALYIGCGVQVLTIILRTFFSKSVTSTSV